MENNLENLTIGVFAKAAGVGIAKKIRKSADLTGENSEVS